MLLLCVYVMRRKDVELKIGGESVCAQSRLATLYSYTNQHIGDFAASLLERYHGRSKKGDDSRLRLQCRGRFLPRSSNACCRH